LEDGAELGVVVPKPPNPDVPNADLACGVTDGVVDPKADAGAGFAAGVDVGVVELKPDWPKAGFDGVDVGVVEPNVD